MPPPEQTEIMVLRRSGTLFPNTVYCHVERKLRIIQRQITMESEEIAKAGGRDKTTREDGITAMRRWFGKPPNLDISVQGEGRASNAPQETDAMKSDDKLLLSFVTFDVIKKFLRFVPLRLAIARADEIGRTASADAETYTVSEEDANVALRELLTDTQGMLEKLELFQEA